MCHLVDFSLDVYVLKVIFVCLNFLLLLFQKRLHNYLSQSFVPFPAIHSSWVLFWNFNRCLQSEFGPIEFRPRHPVRVKENFAQEVLKQSIGRCFLKFEPENDVAERVEHKSPVYAQMMRLHFYLDFRDFPKEVLVLHSELPEPSKIAVHEKAQQISKRNQVIPA